MRREHGLVTQHDMMGELRKHLFASNLRYFLQLACVDDASTVPMIALGRAQSRNRAFLSQATHVLGG